MAGNVIGTAATVAQLVGFKVDTSGLISKIKQAADTAQQNQEDCKVLASQVDIIAELLPHMEDPETMRPLAGLGAALKDAYVLVQSCQGSGRTYRFFNARKQAVKFKNVRRRIASLLAKFPVMSFACRSDGTGSVTVLNHAQSSNSDGTGSLSPLMCSDKLKL